MKSFENRNTQTQHAHLVLRAIYVNKSLNLHLGFVRHTHSHCAFVWAPSFKCVHCTVYRQHNFCDPFKKIKNKRRNYKYLFCHNDCLFIYFGRFFCTAAHSSAPNVFCAYKHTSVHCMVINSSLNNWKMCRTAYSFQVHLLSSYRIAHCCRLCRVLYACSAPHTDNVTFFIRFSTATITKYILAIHTHTHTYVVQNSNWVHGMLLFSFCPLPPYTQSGVHGIFFPWIK